MNAEDLAAAVRAAVADHSAVKEVKMFGGIGFMLNGNLLVGASHRGLLVRLGKDRAVDALKKPGARPMIMRGRTMEDYVYVDPPALNARSVKSWVRLAVSFVSALPPKRKRS
jgi:TfoX/Sxy family transcriptional regulator of competence genes